MVAQNSLSCEFKCQRYPRKEHWQALKALSNDCLMEPKEFLENWEVNYEQLAKIAGCSYSHVKRWFHSGKNSYPPSKEHKLRLAIVHKLWSKI